jgi:hypothetical protein
MSRTTIRVPSKSCEGTVNSLRSVSNKGSLTKAVRSTADGFFLYGALCVPKLDERRVLQGYLLSWSRSCCSNNSAGVQYFFVVLHAAQHGTTLPFVLRPPREIGTM